MTYKRETIIIAYLHRVPQCITQHIQRPKNILSHLISTRATICVSVVFTDFRCPSIHLSRWWILSTRLKTSLIFLFGPVDRHFNFLNPCADTQFQGNPVSGGEKYTAGAGKIGDFRRKSPFISDTVRDNHGYYGTLIGSHSWRIDPCRFR